MKKIATFAAPILIALCSSAAMAAEPDYTLNPGDVLQIDVWKEEGMNLETLVMPDGSITFPLAGTIHAQGLTTEQTQAAIKDRLKPYIPEAAVTVAVKAALGNVVNVIGQVALPGVQTPGRRVTVMQALSAAGGLTPYASESRIIILRRTADKQVAIPFPYDDVIRGRSLDKDIILQTGDVVVVPTASLF